MHRFFQHRGNFIATVVSFIILVFLIDTGLKAYAQNQRKNEIKEEQSFKRPEPSRPAKPEVPSVNRYQDDKVFLEYADSLYKIHTYDTIERQILKGNVKFRQAGLWMYCDSAYYYPNANSLDAFSNVKMEQGDTLFVYADKLFYNGDLHLAKLKNGFTRDKVTLINRDVTLTTDSLDYDMAIDIGWYTRWGKIEDKVNTLTSLYGEYSPKTKQAEFYHDVVLVNHKDGFTMYTDTLHYNTQTHIANIESRTEIQSENDTIITSLATYYTDTGDADLLSRSLIIHRDSTGNVTTLEGDSIIYDNKSRISRAYMFRDLGKISNPMVITDTAQKTTLIGGFGIYNDSTKEAVATIYPLLMEYSQKDTLFLRADTIKTYIVTEKVPVKRKRKIDEYPLFNGNPIVKIDTVTGIWYDSLFFTTRPAYIDDLLMYLLRTNYPDAFKKLVEETVETPVLAISDSLAPETSQLILTDSITSNIPADIGIKVIEESDSLIFEADTVINEISSIIEISPPSAEVKTSDSQSEETIERISLSGIMQLPSDTIENEKDSTINLIDSVPKEFHVILAYHRGRFFKQDMQGVADSLVFVERDSMLYMFRKPIIWSEERQVTGNRIDVHFNDSTTDWAYLPEFGLMSEHVDEDFYNQIYGKEIMTYFEGQGLRRMSVNGNVETIFLPQEEDSTYNRLVNAESSYMEVYLDSNKLDWLKMWPEVSGTVTPLFMIKRNQMYLQKFKWWGFLRPEREWYGNRVRWADDLGEVPDELEQYFITPSDFGEPKSFTGPRIILPPSSLPILNDSILGEAPAMEISDTVADSPGVEEVERTETLGDIEDSELSEEEAAESTEEQTEEIEDTVEKEEAAEKKDNPEITPEEEFNQNMNNPDIEPEEGEEDE